MIIGISTACYFGTLVLEDAIQQIAEMGVKHIEVFLNTVSEYDADYVKGLRETADRYGSKIWSVHPHGVQFEPQLFSPYARSSADSRDVYKKVLAAARILGAENYIFHGGLFFKPAIQNSLNFSRLGRIISELAELAGEYGIRLAYENVHWCWYSRPDFASRLLEYVTSDNLKFNFDIKQAAQSGYDPVSYVAPMGDRLVSVHACDYKKSGSYFYPCMPFSGDMDFPGLRQKLWDVGYNGPLMLEVYSNNYRDSGELYANYLRMREFFSPSEAGISPQSH